MTLCPSRSSRGALAAALALLFAGPELHAETKNFDILDLLRSLKIASNTELIATREGYVLRGVQDGGVGAKPQAGDSVTALVELGSFLNKQRPTQWIIRLQMEAELPADSALGQASNLTRYSNTGEKFTFLSNKTGMKLETLGPIKAGTKPDQSLPVKYRQIVASTDFLGLDLYRTAQFFWRIKDSKLTPGNGPKPYPVDEVNLQHGLATALNVTSDDLRSFAGSGLALEQFLGIVRNTPDLQEVLFQVLDKPSFIDVVRSGANTSLNFDFQGGGHSEGQEIFWPETRREDFSLIMLTLDIFGKPALEVALFVTTPRPPLLVSAGIVGVVAFSPSKPNKYVVVRVLSAAVGISTTLKADIPK